MKKKTTKSRGNVFGDLGFDSAWKCLSRLRRALGGKCVLTVWRDDEEKRLIAGYGQKERKGFSKPSFLISEISQ